MSRQAYLIDTNVIIGLEDNKAVQPAFAAFMKLATKHKVDFYIHEAARDDIARDKDVQRREISLSKLEKFSCINKVRGFNAHVLGDEFGQIRKPNDIVDVTLLHALHIGTADFLVTQDRGLHERARRHSSELGRRVLHVADAVELLKTTFEPIESPVRFVEEVAAHTIPLSDSIFASLREDYPPFDQWWKDKCVREHRTCWIISSDQNQNIAGLVVRKDESPENTDATLPAKKILKICTFKVRPESRGFKLGELLLKKVFWFAQKNSYDLVYVTTYDGQAALIDLLEYYGFQHTATKPDGELIYEKTFSQDVLVRNSGEDLFKTARLNYPRFVTDQDVRAFGIPIKEGYHDILYPDLKSDYQGDLFENAGLVGPQRPGNTIRKVYLCRAKSNLGEPGSLLFFYKGKSKHDPSQAFTTIGILEEVATASSTKELMKLAGGRSVYSEKQLEDWAASSHNPIKVINYLLACYIDPPIGMIELQEMNVFTGHPPQSIFEIKVNIDRLLARSGVGFKV
ncbi:GNAT family N-acetyltransferase [Pseudomonas aeruginosa]|uniref:GNAT family N-acetyltransferase n=1 Tax=Pseudomonas aeruginosa TaxID=287 RepID=UPI000FF68AD9|nr:GNAT family N-acetyltransferase [Pseudomonas aeruginosa]RQA92881.1 GNAT family N-acetyltransferase [Pseudomonas aeruginosa]